PDGWIELEDGIEVQLAGTPRPGDYWLIPARSFNHDVEWPQGELPPHGIGRHYSRLALVELKDEEFSPREDCRFLFSPLNDLRALTAVRSALNAPDGTIYVDEAGNVGIGTREPSGRLEVRGDIVVREGAAAGNVNVEGNLEVAQTISGNADAHFHRNVSVVGDLTAGQSISTKKVDSDRVDAGTVNVTGDLEVARTIRGNADAHFAQNVNVAGDLTAARSIITPKLSSDTVDAEKVSVAGELEVAQTIRGNADAYFHGNVYIEGDLTATRGIGKVFSEVGASDRVGISSYSKDTDWVDMRDMGMKIFTKHSRIFVLLFHAGGVRGHG
ncbi:MAG: hypothetical protein GY835_25140, partial [bacterium]|nr:hypothetical protein [bacterium]